MRVDFFFFLADQWEFDALVCLYHAILADNVFGTFLVIGVSPNENWDRVWVLYVYMDYGLSLP